MRAEREQGSYRGEPQGQPPQQGAYEMSGLREPDQVAPPSTGGHGLSAFQQEISDIQDLLRQFDSNVSRISTLHAQSLNNMDPNTNQQNQTVLDEQVDETRQLSNQIKQRITKLEQQPVAGGDIRIQKNQTSLIRKKFVEALQNYQKVEKEYRTRYKQRVERQFKIVKPDATADEINAVVNDTNGAGGQIFAQALTSSTRYSESRMAYREAQERHEEILRIEQNIAELAQLMNDMSILVAQGDEQIDNIETTAANVQNDMEQGVKQTEQAVVHARRARKMRWICFWITLVLAAIIAIVVAVVVTQVVNKK